MFKVYYANGETYAGDPFEAPAWGALLIVESDPDHGRRIVSNLDYFVWLGHRWRSVDFIGLIDYLAQPGPRKVLIGRMVDNDLWYETWRRAESDPDFLPRTGRHPYEPNP